MQQSLSWFRILGYQTSLDFWIDNSVTETAEHKCEIDEVSDASRRGTVSTQQHNLGTYAFLDPMRILVMFSQRMRYIYGRPIAIGSHKAGAVS